MDGTHRTKKRAAAILLGFFAAAAIAMPSAQAADRTVSELIPVGQTVGVKLFSDGVLVVGFSDGESPAKDCGLKEGDVITAICGQSLDTIEEFRQLLAENGDDAAALTVKRGSRTIELSAEPEKDEDGEYRLGAWVRDSMAGIGTMTFFDPQSGSISVGGVNVKDIDKNELMNTVSFVFQNSHLVKGTILDNVRMGKPDAADEEVLAALRAAQCTDIIEKFPDGVHTVIGSQGIYLSGGEAQRLAIARAMLKNAPVLILDEATAFADPDNETKVQAAFNELAKGRTVIMIAHRLSTVVNADRIFVLNEGQLSESGSFAELSGKKGSLFGTMWQDYQQSVRWKVEKEV